MIWNSQYATDPINLVQGDKVYLYFNIQIYDEATETWIDYDLTGKSLRLKIVNNHGGTIADWQTATGEIITAGSYLIIDTNAVNSIACCGSFDGQLIEVSPQLTLWFGIFKMTGGII